MSVASFRLDTCSNTRQLRTRPGFLGGDPAGFLAGVSEQLAKLPGELWRTGNDGFADIAAAMDALAVQVDCARVALIQEAESRGVVDSSPSPSTED